MDLDQLRRDGYTVVAQAVTPELVAAAIDVVRGPLEAGRWGMVPVWGHQALWDVRQHPPVHAAFAAAYGTEALWVSMDRMSVKPPGAPGLAVHWDRDLADDDAPLLLQGVVALTDAPAGAGGFCCVPELFRDRHGWLERHPDGPTWDIDLEGHVPTPVPARAGDIILFDACLPHGSEPNGGTVPRIAQYVSMFVAGEDGTGRVELYEAGRSTFPQYDGRVEPWPPATLTPLGRRLLGAEPWPIAARQP